MDLHRIHHVAVICSNYERSKYFYTQVLGLPIVRENYQAHRGGWKLDLRVGEGAELELFYIPGAPPRLDRPEACGLRHLAFYVPSVREAAAELKAKGVPCEPVRVDDYTGKAMTFFRDPDGLPLELHE